ncbi:hypothetical protein CANCADRAFT_21770 [Tortispora caseinolytica NRRL Y-17796]|uniref:Ergosterol biosynthesis protein n=1 Tax=Tortispora caseinolytica NRRL Y-17796 TaxID=767744 RepID=A0A1E4TL59_9ASCO|nr:hypothetical protein CANCADRAFT_21770 [Tortispora caseinolytica NRRL Y-17796]
MDKLTQFLPQEDGYLPKWLFFISVVSMFNSVQTYLGPQLSKQVYAGAPEQVTGLSARTFGTWTMITSIVRLFGSYYIRNEPVYKLTIATFWVAFGHFQLEWLVYKTARFGKGLAGPFIVSTASLVWMYKSWDYYLN